MTQTALDVLPLKPATALISGPYRYTLTRDWSSEVSKRAIWIMLNPSTADALVDDPTIRRCIAFAKREGCGALSVVNLYAFRAADPRALGEAATAGVDPVGPENDRVLELAVFVAAWHGWPIIAAWGAQGSPARKARVVEFATRHRASLLCLGTTKDGGPRHPLYVRADQPLQPWPVTHG